ncbi:MAG: hypothetical protein QXO51_02925 [Halobacteria archaeon]
MVGTRAAAATLLLSALLLAPAGAQTRPTVEECVADYAKQFNLSDADARAKCLLLFASPSPSPGATWSPWPSLGPFPSPPATWSPPLLPGPSPWATAAPAESCLDLYMKEKGLAYEDAKRLCAGVATLSPRPAADDLLACIARVQKEKGLDYDGAKRACAAAMVAATASDCVARAQREKGVGEEEARKACATPHTTRVPSAFSMEGCVEKHLLGGMSKEEADKFCASMAGASEASPAPRRPVAREVAERLREKVTAAEEKADSWRSCLKDARGAMERCAAAGKPAGECGVEVARQMEESCAAPGVAEAGGGACAAKCAEEGRSCLGARSEEVCRKEVVACLTQCPGAAGRLGTVAMKMEHIREVRIGAREATALDEDQKPVEVVEGKMEVRTVASPPAAAGPGAPEAPGGRSLAGSARGLLTLSLPVKLAVGKSLSSFEHAPSGIALKDDEFSMPLRAGAEVAARIRAKVQEVVGRGNAAEMVVDRLQMETKAIEADLSGEKPRVGQVLAKLVADLKDMPEQAEVKVTPLAALAPERQQAVEEAARNRDLRVKEIAYAVEVEHQNLDVNGANITLTVSREWVESQGGADKVRIFRHGDDGSKQVLQTVFLGYDGDSAVFEGVSPGLSVFSLVAVEIGAETVPASPPKSSPPFGLLGLVAAIGIAIAVTLGLAKRPPGKMNPWLRISMKASGDLKDVEEMQKKQNGG